MLVFTAAACLGGDHALAVRGASTLKRGAGLASACAACPNATGGEYPHGIITPTVFSEVDAPHERSASFESQHASRCRFSSRYPDPDMHSRQQRRMTNPSITHYALSKCRNRVTPFSLDDQQIRAGIGRVRPAQSHSTTTDIFLARCPVTETCIPPRRQSNGNEPAGGWTWCCRQRSRKTRWLPGNTLRQAHGPA